MKQASKSQSPGAFSRGARDVNVSALDWESKKEGEE